MNDLAKLRKLVKQIEDKTDEPFLEKLSEMFAITGALSSSVPDLIDEIEKLRDFCRRIPSRTHHGPQGRGESGDCSPDCIKCEAQRLTGELAP